MAKNRIYNTVGGIIRIGLSVLTIPLLIGIMGVEEYGLWALASAMIGVVTLAEAGLSMTATVFISRDLAAGDREGIRQTITVVLGGMLALATLAALGLVLGASIWASFFPVLDLDQQVALTRALQLGGMVVWARLLQNVSLAVEHAYQRYDLANILGTAQSALTSLGLLAIALLGGRTVALMGWQVIVSLSMMIAHGITSAILLGWQSLRLAWNTAKTVEIAHYSSLAWLTTLGSVIFVQFDRVIVGRILGPGLLGVYAAITNVVFQINVVSALPVQPLLPNLSGVLAAKSDQGVVRKQIRRSYNVNAFVALGMGAILLTCAPLVTRIVLLDSSGHYTTAFRLAVVIYTLYSLNAVGYYLLLGVGAVQQLMVISLLSGVLSLVMIVVGAGLFGLLGAVAGNAVYIATWLLNVCGMRYLEFPKMTWFRWTLVPLAWFVVVVWVSASVEQPMLAGLLFIFQSAVLVLWFMGTHSDDVRQAIRGLLAQTQAVRVMRDVSDQ